MDYDEEAGKYDEYIQDIILKMRHSLTLYSNILFQRYEMDGISETLRQTDLSALEIVLVLVVKEAEKEWLIPFQDKFRRELREEIRIWKSSLIVINEAMARAKHFIL